MHCPSTLRKPENPYGYCNKFHYNSELTVVQCRGRSPKLHNYVIIKNSPLKLREKRKSKSQFTNGNVTNFEHFYKRLEAYFVTKPTDYFLVNIKIQNCNKLQ